jgi:hypothetical protein
MGAILQQRDDNGDLHPIAYASKTFNSAQKNYDTTEREALAIPWSLQHFNTYCEGHKYTIFTDHKALSYIRTNKDNTKRITRWQMMLQNYNIDNFNYIKGEDNHAADLLSRPMMDKKEVNVCAVRTRQKKRVRKQHTEDYQVETIVDRRENPEKKGEIQYLIRWKGYTSADDTWLSVDRASGASELIVEYEKRASELEAIRARGVESSRDDYTCEKCDEKFHNSSSKFMHQWKEHKMAVPTNLLDKLEVNQDPSLFSALQRKDRQFRCIYNSEFDRVKAEDMQFDKEARRILRNHEFILSESDLLYCVDVTNSRSRTFSHTRLRLCIPLTERKRIMNHYHQLNHPGIIHLYDTMREHVWWPGMIKDVNKYVNSCHTCQINKGERENKSVRPMSLPTRPWSHIAIDHVGPFPMSNHGHKYILVIIDRFTRYAEAVAVTDVSAKTTAEAIAERILCRYGIPEVMLSDRGTSFTSEIFSHMLKVLGIKQIKTTAYHPSSNGAVERFNKTLKKTLKLWVNQQQTDWDLLLPFALFAYNTAVHSTLLESPHYLNYGQHPRTVTDVITQRDNNQSVNVHAYASELQEKLSAVHNQVRHILSKINEERQDEIEEKQEQHIFKEGDQVFLHDPTTPVHRSQKFIKRWHGPYTIIRKKSNNTSVIIVKDGEMLVANDRLRLVRDGMESVSEKHSNNVLRALEEIEVIDDQVRNLVERKRKLAVIQEVSDAVIASELLSSSSSSSSTSSKDLEEIEDENTIYDDEENEDDWIEKVEVNMMAYVQTSSVQLH